MTEELSPFLIEVFFVVDEVMVPLGLSSKIRPQISSIVFDFNKNLRACQAKIEDISFSLPKQIEFVRYIDLGVLISRDFAMVCELCNSKIQEKASSLILELSSLRFQGLTRKDSEGIDSLIVKFREAPASVFFVEVHENHIAVGDLIGKTIQT